MDSGPKCAAKFGKVAKRAADAKSLRTTALCKQNFAYKTFHLKYKKYGNLLTGLQKKTKINYYRYSFNVRKKDSTYTWKLINQIIN